jgi:hypothetical protein
MGEIFARNRRPRPPPSALLKAAVCIQRIEMTQDDKPWVVRQFFTDAEAWCRTEPMHFLRHAALVIIIIPLSILVGMRHGTDDGHIA